MWKLFQISVFIGIACLGTYYEWTPNGVLLGFTAWFLTVIATMVVSSLLLKLRTLLRHQRTNNRIAGRRKIPRVISQ